MPTTIFLTIIKWWCNCLDLSFEIVARPWKPEELPYRRMIGGIFGQPWKLTKSYPQFLTWNGSRSLSTWKEVRQRLTEFTQDFWQLEEAQRQLTPSWPTGTPEYLEEVFTHFFNEIGDETTVKAFRMLHGIGDNYVPKSQLAGKLGVEKEKLYTDIHRLLRRFRSLERTRAFSPFAFQSRMITIDSIIEEWRNQKKAVEYARQMDKWGWQIPVEILDCPVEELELSVRSYNCLKNTNINTIGEILSVTEAELSRRPNFGRKSLNEINEVLVGVNSVLKIGLLIKEKQPE